MKPTYANITPLIIDITESGRSIQVVFQCPISRTQIPARASASRDNSIGAQVKSNAQRSLMYAIQREVGSILRSVFGNNVLGRTASDISRRTMSSASSQMLNGLSKTEKEEAIVKAFLSVQRKFTWDEKRQQWVSADSLQQTMSPFQQQQHTHPISHPYDMTVLSRMLVEIAMADGQMTRSERDWLMMLFNPESGTIEQIAQNPKLSSAELANTSSGGTRTTLLMLTWAVALCDEDLAQAEQIKLQEFEQGLQLSSQEAHRAKQLAQSYILESAIEYIYSSSLGNGNFSRQQVLTVATNIGLSETEALDIEAKVKRRQSNF